MKNFHAAILGFVAAVVTISIAAFIPKSISLQFFGILLGVIAGVYLGYGISDGRAREIIIECGNIFLMLSLIFTGILVSPYFLALGYFAHGIWDIAHHPKLVQTKVPQSYIYLCSIYDWVAGIFIVVWWM